MNIEEKIALLAEYINKSKYIVFLGGAGVSTESGIPDFRSASGLYNRDGEGVPPEVMLSKTYFYENTESFYKFHKTKMLYPEAEPNDAHKILAKFEEKGKIKAVVTQNIDGLHQKAGSKTVVELHGSVKNNYCLQCRKNFGVDYIIGSEGVPYCDNCGGLIKPGVVLYEEQLDLDAVHSAAEHMINADMLIVGGTSLAVTTAVSSMSWFFSRNKNKTKKSAIINKTKTEYDRYFDLTIKEGLSRVLRDAYFKIYDN